MIFQGMIFQDYVFYSLAIILLFAGLRVITARNPVHAALFLVLAFFTAAGIWLLLEAEFLAIALVLVYVGAVMVLFLFVVINSFSLFILSISFLLKLLSDLRKFVSYRSLAIASLFSSFISLVCSYSFTRFSYFYL